MEADDRVSIHADDFGLTAGVNATIGECIEAGCLDGVSVMVNGAAFEPALELCSRHDRLRTAIHLNLVEGEPVAGPAAVPLLLGEDGRLRAGFPRLWMHSSSPRFVEQVALEIRAQMRRFAAAWGDRPFAVDSHQHTHMVPRVFDAMLDACKDFNISRVRLPCEPLWLVRRSMPLVLLAGSGLLKNRLLHRLSARARPRLERAGLGFNRLFLGVVGTGRMRADYVRRAIAATRDDPAATLEILFHPGEAAHDELSLWSDRPGLRAYYGHAERSRERHELLSLSARRRPES